MLDALNEAMERTQWDLFWIPDHLVVHDRPEILYRASREDRILHNTVTRLRAPRPRFAALVDEVSSAHAGVSSRWQVPLTSNYEGLESILPQHGYALTAEHDTRGIAVDAFTAKTGSNARVVRVSDAASLRELKQVSGRAFGRDEELSNAELERQVMQCASPEGRVHRFLAYEGEQPVSGGGLTMFDDLGVGFLWAGSTLPEAQGRGHYRAVVAARVEFARRRGLTMVGVYARTATSSPIVAAQGFAKVGDMVYWDRAAHRV